MKQCDVFSLLTLNIFLYGEEYSGLGGQLLDSSYTAAWHMEIICLVYCTCTHRLTLNNAILQSNPKY